MDKQPVDSLSKLSSLMKANTTTVDSRDIDSLTKSIDNLTKILNKRTGKSKKSSGIPAEKEDASRTILGDIKDFGRGFFGPALNTKEYNLGGKKTMPNNISLNNSEADDKSENKNLNLTQLKNELSKLKNNQLEKNLLAEVVVIRKIVAHKAGLSDNKTAIPAALSGSGLEPNTEEDKQRDRELLATAIADKLKGLADTGGGGLFSNILEFLGLKEVLGNKKPAPGKSGKGKSSPKVPPGSRAGGGLGSRLLGPASLAYGAYEASEFLGESGYGERMAEGAGKTAQRAFRENVAPTIDPVKAGITPEEARNALGGSERDIEKLGGREALLKIANTDFESSSNSKDLKEQLRIKEQSLKNLDPSLESNKQYKDKLQSDIDALNKRIPTADMPDQTSAETARLNRSPNIETKPIDTVAAKLNIPETMENNLYKNIMQDAFKQLDVEMTGDKRNLFLKQLEDENMDLKTAASTSSQVLAPMVSNKTIDNSTQTFVTSPPKPYPNSNGYDRWQNRVDGKL